jgi:hypothetical protein
MLGDNEPRFIAALNLVQRESGRAHQFIPRQSCDSPQAATHESAVRFSARSE